MPKLVGGRYLRLVNNHFHAFLTMTSRGLRTVDPDGLCVLHRDDELS